MGETSGSSPVCENNLGLLTNKHTCVMTVTHLCTISYINIDALILKTFCKQHHHARLNNSVFITQQSMVLNDLWPVCMLFGFLCLQTPQRTKYSEYHHISFTIFHIRAKLCFTFVQFCVFIVVFIQFVFQLSAQKRPPLTNGGIGKLMLVQDQCKNV